jgi:hypothetical protein
MRKRTVVSALKRVRSLQNGLLRTVRVTFINNRCDASVRNRPALSASKDAVTAIFGRGHQFRSRQCGFPGTTCVTSIINKVVFKKWSFGKVA